MPYVGWSVEQRAELKRRMLFVNVFAVAGAILSLVLIAGGNTGGWVVLGMTACMYGALQLLLGHMRRRQPR
ncbi:hypothetical protein [Streptomyces sp. NPDC085937]|uniref:hypothetical protein n=1 Tax=Streptomyces sp. NPDC085937 TaxID=3365742 RepID=UPI0037CFCCCA